VEMITQAMRGEMQQMKNEMKNNINGNACKMNGKMKEMENNINGNACKMNGKMENKMDENMQTLRGEMQRVGRCLQAGIMVVACSETQTVECKMGAPRAGANELRESVDCVGPAVETGEVTIIQETCWTRLVTAERVTVTEREKLNGVTETCTRHVETREIMNEVKELTETREIEETEGELDETKDEHTHMELARDNEGELGECVVARYKQQDSLLQERGEGICPPEADHDQVGPVELCELGGASAANGCTQSLGGKETPGALVVVRLSQCVCLQVWQNAC